MYYVATSWDESGHSPSQDEIDKGLENLKTSPSTHSYNVCCWQPHLANPKLVGHIWDWIEYYTNAKLDYESMQLADKQVWWLIAPEPSKFENDSDVASKEYIFSRQKIIDQINDPMSFHNEKTGHRETQRALYPRIYMQVQSFVDYMYRTHSYVPIILNKPSLFPVEFNYEFGSYFNNIPVLPVCMSTFYSKPKTVKHNGTGREMISSGDKSLTSFKTYPALDKVNGSTLPETYNWENHRNPKASKLSQEECIALYAKRTMDERPVRNFKELNFNLSADLI
jgi:hypothetical protein